MNAATGKPGILVINGCLPPPYGGIAKFLSHMLPLLVAHGYPVWAAMPRHYSPHDYPAYQAQGVNIVIPRGQKKLTVATAFKLAVQYAPALWERTVQYKLPLKEALVLLFRWLPELDDVLDKHGDQIDLIHVYDAPWAQGWIGKLLSEKYQKPWVLTTYGEVVPHRDPIQLIDELSEQYRPFCKKIVEQARVIGSMTAYCASKLAYIGVDPSRVLPTHHIVGMEAFIQRPALTDELTVKYPILQQKRIVLFVGQLLPRKGPDLLLRVIGDILIQHPDCFFVFIGPDLGFLPELKKMAAEYKVTNSCLFTGPLSDEEVTAFYWQSTLFVFPTVSPIECLGLTFVQAIYAHCPVVASDISGVPEIIRDGENGLLFAPGQPQQLYKAIIRLLDDRALAHRLAEQAFADITQNFCPESALKQIEVIYQTASA